MERKIRAERNKVENQKTNESLFSEKINKIDIFLPQLIRKQRKKTQTTNFKNERSDITTDFIDIKKIGSIMNNFIPINSVT